MLSDRCLFCPACLSICDVGALWPNGLTDQDETWHSGRPRPWPPTLCWMGTSSPLPNGHAQPPNFRPMSVVAKWLDGFIKMPLGMEVNLGPGDVVLWGRSSHLKEAQPPVFGACLLWQRSPISATAELLFQVGAKIFTRFQ